MVYVTVTPFNTKNGLTSFTLSLQGAIDSASIHSVCRLRAEAIPGLTLGERQGTPELVARQS